MIQIYYVDALAGSGKTYQALHHAVKLAALGEKIAIIAFLQTLTDEEFVTTEKFSNPFMAESRQ
jgi:hypothetical protein